MWFDNVNASVRADRRETGREDGERKTCSSVLCVESGRRALNGYREPETGLLCMRIDNDSVCVCVCVSMQASVCVCKHAGVSLSLPPLSLSLCDLASNQAQKACQGETELNSPSHGYKSG